MIPNATAAFNEIASGNIINGLTMPFTDIMGNVFYGLFFLLAVYLIYAKTQNFQVTVVVVMLIIGSVAVLIPETWQTVIYIFVAIGVTAILYRLVK